MYSQKKKEEALKMARLDRENGEGWIYYCIYSSSCDGTDCDIYGFGI